MASTPWFRLCLALVLLLDAALVLPALASHGFWLADEARIALIAQQMAASGDWVVPRIGGEVYARYPPLAFWLMALSGSVFGWSELALRLPGALAGVGLIAVAGQIARRLAGERAGLAAAIVLASLPAFADEQLVCRANLLLALGSCFAFERFLAIAGGERRAAHVTGFWLALAFAVLAKGPAGLAITGVGVLAWLALERKPEALWALRPAWGLPLFAALVLPWYALAAARDGSEFLWMNLVLENVSAFATGFEHPRPVWFYLVRLPVGLLPWIAFGPLVWRVRAARGLPLALAWSGGLLLLLSVAGNKRASYLCWLHPAFAIAVGIGLHALADVAPLALRRGFGAVFGAIAATGAVLALGAFVPVVPVRLPEMVARAAQPAAVLAAFAASVSVAGLFVSRRTSVTAAGCALALATALGGSLFHAVLEPRLDTRAREGAEFCREIEALVPPGESIGIVAGILSEPGLHVYLRRRLERRAGEPGVYLVSRSQRDELALAGRPLQVLASRQIGHGQPTLLVRVYD